MRLAIVLLVLMATAGLGYRAYQDELALRQNAGTARQAVDLADRTLTAAADLRAALHAYVAPGQGSPFWVSRSGVLVEELQTGLTSLSSIDPNGNPIAAEAMTKLVAAEKRARGFLRDNQELLASDVVFTECRDQLDAVRLQIAGARDRVLAATDSRDATLRREQYILLGATLASWFICTLLLMPTGQAAEPHIVRVPERPIETDIPLTAPQPMAPQPVAPPPPAPVAVVTKMPPPPPVPKLPEAAQVCVDMARVSNAEQIAPLLKRAADVLDATGLIVWVTSADGKSLVPVASCGYDARVIERVGSLPLDGENLTSAAFRDAARRTTAARNGAAAAIAVPLVGPAGSIGVLSGEVRSVERVGETTSSIASIFGAQLATLVGSMPPAEAEPEGEPEPTESTSEEHANN